MLRMMRMTRVMRMIIDLFGARKKRRYWLRGGSRVFLQWDVSTAAASLGVVLVLAIYVVVRIEEADKAADAETETEPGNLIS